MAESKEIDVDVELIQVGSSFMKYDNEKPRMDLVPPEALLEVAKVLAYGAGKYAPNNWRRATTWNRYYAAAMRHLMSWQAGEDFDYESGLPHLAHAACCLMFLLSLQHTGVGTDDRYRVRTDVRK